MYQLQNINDFLQSPMGKGTSIIPNRKLILEDLERRYDIIQEKSESVVYFDKRSDGFFFHVNIPTEGDLGNDYDVIIQFLTPKGINLNDLNGYHIKIFSNSPGFAYTYGYVALHEGLLIDFLKSKYDKYIQKKSPVQRNPYGVIMYEKSIVFAINHILKNYDLKDKEKIITMSEKFDQRKFSNNVRDVESILEEIDTKKYLRSREKRREKMELDERSNTLRKVSNEKVSQRSSTSKKSSVNKIKATKSTSNKSGVKTIKPKKKL